MLDHQDIETIKTIVKDETSDIRQDVSILKQEQSRQGTQMEVMNHKFDTALELLLDIRDKVTDHEQIKHIVQKNHSPRIMALELAFKKKMA